MSQVYSEGAAVPAYHIHQLVPVCHSMWLHLAWMHVSVLVWHGGIYRAEVCRTCVVDAATWLPAAPFLGFHPTCLPPHHHHPHHKSPLPHKHHHLTFPVLPTTWS